MYSHIVVESGGTKVFADVLSEEPVILSSTISSPSTNSWLKSTQSSRSLLPLYVWANAFYNLYEKYKLTYVGLVTSGVMSLPSKLKSFQAALGMGSSPVPFPGKSCS